MGEIKANIKVKTNNGYDHILPSTKNSMVTNSTMTQTEYDGLSEAEKNDGTIRFIEVVEQIY